VYWYKIGRETCRSWLERTNGPYSPVHQNTSYDTWTDFRLTSSCRCRLRLEVLSSIRRRYRHCYSTQQRNIRNVLAYRPIKFKCHIRLELKLMKQILIKHMSTLHDFFGSSFACFSPIVLLHSTIGYWRHHVRPSVCNAAHCGLQGRCTGRVPSTQVLFCPSDTFDTKRIKNESKKTRKWYFWRLIIRRALCYVLLFTDFVNYWSLVSQISGHALFGCVHKLYTPWIA